MRLAELDPEWIRWEDVAEPRKRVAPGWDTSSEAGLRAWSDAGRPSVEDLGPVTYVHVMPALAEAQGIEFDCPKCRDHRIQVAFRDRGVLDHQATRSKDGTPTRWQVVAGAVFDDLSLSPSIDCTPSNPNCWHGHVTAGAIT